MLEQAGKTLPTEEFDYAKALALAFLNESKVAELEQYERWRTLEPLHPKSTGNSWDKLTPRQREVLQLVAEGRTTKEIAATLDISVKTVETYRQQLMQQLDIHDVAGLVRYAISKGIDRL